MSCNNTQEGLSYYRHLQVLFLWLYNESCGLFDSIRIISVVSIERNYLFSLVLVFYSLANGIGYLMVLIHTMFVNVYHHLLWCCYSAHVVRRVSTYGGEG